MKKIFAAGSLFFFKPASARPISALRISLSALLLLQAFLLRTTVLDFFSAGGIVQGDLADHFINPLAPRIAWLSSLLADFSISETTTIYFCCGLYLLSLILLGIGLFTRTASIFAWLLHWTLMNTGDTTAYGVDLYAHVFLFYLIWVPAGAAWSLDRVFGRLKGEPSVAARLGLRVMQLHLCITYLSSAVEKAGGIQWWNGELLWRALNLPVYQQYEMTWLVEWPWLLRISGWTCLMMEGLYFLLIWPKQTRPYWIAGMLMLHLGIAIFLGLDLFGLMMCALTFSLFAFSPEAEGQPILFLNSLWQRPIHRLRQAWILQPAANNPYSD